MEYSGTPWVSSENNLITIKAGGAYGQTSYRDFQRMWYGATDFDHPGIKRTIQKIKKKFNDDPKQFDWGEFQKFAVKKNFWPKMINHWGEIVDTFDLWEAAAREMKEGLHHKIDPQTGKTYLEILNEFHRMAFWPASGDPLPLDITVTRQGSWTDDHGFYCNWDDPANPKALVVKIACPNAGVRKDVLKPNSWTPGIGGWAAWARSPTFLGQNVITKFQARLPVPAAPTASPTAPAKEQLIYIFPGLQANTGATGTRPGILQPVLQWGRSPVLGGVGKASGWSVGCWFVGLGQPWETVEDWQLARPQDLPAGTTELLCEITQTAIGGGLVDCQCNVRDANTDTLLAELPIEDVAQLTFATVALEVYGATHKNHLPDPNFTFNQIAMEVNKSPTPITWTFGNNNGQLPAGAAFAVTSENFGKRIRIRR